MALLDIVQAGDPVLRQRAREVDADDVRAGKYERLVQDMIETMREAPGVGLAAPQVGVGLRIIVVEDDAARIAKLDPKDLAERGRDPFPLTVVFNPVLEVEAASTVSPDDRPTFFEGCLSLDGFAALVPRARVVRVGGLDAHGAPLDLTVSGWPARIFQHEVDHVDGTLYVDRMLTRSFASGAQVTRHWGGLPVREIRERLGC